MTIHGRIRRRRFMAVGAAASSLMPAGAFGQAPDWPSRPVRFVCGYAPGGLTDLFARLGAEHFATRYGKPFIVENRTGAGSMIAGDIVAKSPPDGYTLLFTNSTAMFQNQVVFKSVPYDAAKDFTPVSMLSADKVPLCVHSSVPGNSDLAALVAYARKNKTSFGTTGIGSLAHIFCMKLNDIFGIQMEPVHYRGEAPMWADLSAGVTQAACSTLQGAWPAIQAGSARPVAVPTRTRSRRLPDVATFHEQGATHPYLLLESMVCCVAPTGTPVPVIEALSAGMVEMNAQPRMREFVDKFGLDEGAQDRASFATFIREMGPLLTQAVRELNIEPQ
ncbi:tripartite tricarboxylate transporter substrate binding protein [Reyranella sp.]|uniref:Bug family tripartite tricarboxylate transporter substrate binding protein n=1 Tax=Reyranella sp. TaxID=1929291 RepID=UPI00272689F6|nr:tripartite tricarboxylate transporter substrate binding protein [Reyranella sp.]MDO8973779.1 tripartite tricarboxylate transporter substrate binding protein [Reyranella sp.]